MRLTVEGLAKRLGGRRVLDGVELDCDGPGVTSIVGRNGAGKSTFLQVLAGVLRPDAGRILLDGTPLDAAHTQMRRLIGYLPERDEPFPFLTVAEQLGLFASLKRRDRPPAPLLARLGLDPLLGRRMESLSAGERRRACLAVALIGEPALLLLDEPSAGLDPAGVETLTTLLRERESASIVLLASHDLQWLDRLGGRRMRLEEGRLSAEP